MLTQDDQLMLLTTCEAVKSMKDIIEKLSAAIEGRDGLIQEVAVIKSKQIACLDHHDKEPARNSNRLALVAIVVSVFVSPIAAALATTAIKGLFP